MYKKNQRDNIADEEKKILHKIIKLIVKAIRAKLHLSRQEFADKYGFSLRTLKKWEQGVREPDGAARAYLMVLDRNHKAVESALAS